MSTSLPTLTVTIGGLTGQPRHLKGRTAEVLWALIRSGRTGITNIDFPGVRLANVISKLRHPTSEADIPIPISTNPELNARGDGSHGRYILGAPINVIKKANLK